MNPPPTSLPITSLWVIPVHQPQASYILHQDRLAIRFLHDSIHVSMPFSQIIPPSPSPSESKSPLYTSVSLLLSRIQGHHYHLSKFHIYIYVSILYWCFSFWLKTHTHTHTYTFLIEMFLYELAPNKYNIVREQTFSSCPL